MVSFRQVKPIDFFPTYYPALAPPTEPVAPATGSAADPCGALTADEQAALTDEAREAKHEAATPPTLGEIASVALTGDASSSIGSDSSAESESP